MYLAASTGWTLDGESMVQSNVRSDRRQSRWHNPEADQLDRHRGALDRPGRPAEGVQRPPAADLARRPPSCSSTRSTTSYAVNDRPRWKPGSRRASSPWQSAAVAMTAMHGRGPPRRRRNAAGGTRARDVGCASSLGKVACAAIVLLSSWRPSSFFLVRLSGDPRQAAAPAGRHRSRRRPSLRASPRPRPAAVHASTSTTSAACPVSTSAHSLVYDQPVADRCRRPAARHRSSWPAPRWSCAARDRDARGHLRRDAPRPRHRHRRDDRRPARPVHPGVLGRASCSSWSSPSQLHALPASGYGGVRPPGPARRSPSAVYSVAVVARLLRSSLIDVLSAPTTSAPRRAKGLGRGAGRARPRPAQRVAARRHRRRPGGRQPARRRDPHRAGLLLARRRPAHRRGRSPTATSRWCRPPCCSSPRPSSW